MAGLLLTADKGLSKNEILTTLCDFEKATIEPMLKKMAKLSGQKWKIKAV